MQTAYGATYFSPSVQGVFEVTEKQKGQGVFLTESVAEQATPSAHKLRSLPIVSALVLPVTCGKNREQTALRPTGQEAGAILLETRFPEKLPDTLYKIDVADAPHLATPTNGLTVEEMSGPIAEQKGGKEIPFRMAAQFGCLMKDALKSLG